uniref:Arf-GAP with coiled-coil, ANK repeat and PH domain-containing protein n=1 Tax=Sphenodon punctatus TaxID=8508 RepID=A0A8D0LCA8_SPHPU
MCELGNATINHIYEARVDEMNVKRPHPSCTRSEKEAWIRAKYVEKKFITKLPETGIRLSRGGGRRGGVERPPKPILKPKPTSLSRGGTAGGGSSSPALSRTLSGRALWGRGGGSMSTLCGVGELGWLERGAWLVVGNGRLS